MNSYHSNININNIFKILPHRYPFLLIDRVLKFKKFKFLHAIKNCTINEPFLQGHFFQKPIFPGVLIIESMAQAAGILIYKSIGKLDINKLCYFIGIDNARFKKNVIPGDQMFIKVDLLNSTKNINKFKTIVTVNKKIVCVSTIIFFIKFIN
ncbi:3-hydroxyacyl-ACP dehydratase FabZ [Buchnera aphidicola (Muscaphis stroyani)]|uniref:3-hydroxyacyl-[acyl-carrier-protein] dehydratase FabZ n=1 Tax=Buchnera aphidicola (Muscaphis stroyani) TaxID=1241869 RepID=A0A4D6YCR4_9GAMM|nr:3-hydroxyacyl-ACP dehydratase FabZ [Buchnera aphidicola]QCI24321.1 3-hydroxyacyl-ACP dehydratase FabZ [Buchnera aphidicola (Muscaphis stroyani)]